MIRLSEVATPSQKDNRLNLTNTFSINPDTILRILVYILLLLLGIELTLLFFTYYLNYNTRLFTLIQGFFDFDKEANFPTLFSTLLLLFASLLLLFIYKSASSKKIYWLFLSGLFMFLCLDESAQIHEKFDKIKSRVDLIDNSALAHAWVLPYSALVIFLIIFLRNFLLSLPANTRNLFIVSGVIFVTGALGIEIIEGQLKVLNGGMDNLTLNLLYCAEETCEMAGVILFIWALLRYIASNTPSISIRID